MAATIIVNGRSATLESAMPQNGGLWLSIDDLAAATGWEIKPEGACLGERCVPIPRGRESEFLRGDRFNLLALAGYLGQPVVHDEDASAWAIGEAPSDRAAALDSLVAPDFTLPDLEGRPHSLSDYRGHKVLLASWASW